MIDAAAVWLFLAAVVAGAVNAVAGGGTLLTFPAALAAGLPPIVANATNAVALVPGVLASSLRRDVVAVALEDAPTRGIYAITRSDADPHPALGPLVEELTKTLAEVSGS